MRRSKETAIYDRKVPVINMGRVVFEVRPEDVRVMVRAEGYAMVRHTGCMPFVVSEKELRAPLEALEAKAQSTKGAVSLDAGAHTMESKE